MKQTQKRTVVVFGIFDGIHEGHRSLFRQAKQYAQELVVIIGRESASLKLKGKKPNFSEQERLVLVKREEYVDDAVLGDEDQSTYEVLKEIRPGVICFGYDQQDLAQDLTQWVEKQGICVRLVMLEPYKPEIFHSSKLNN